MTHHLPIVADDIAHLKGSGAIIAGGGPHITGEQELAHAIGIDILFSGFGEESFLAFGRELEKTDFDRTPRIYQQTGMEDINATLPISNYFKTIPPLEIMRGCHWNCAYCQTGRDKVEYRSLQSIQQYLDHLKQRKVNRINFISPSSLEYGSTAPLAVNQKTLQNLLELISSYGFANVEYGVFPSEVRPDTVTPDILDILQKHVSNKRLTIGAQSGNNRQLKTIMRGHTRESVETAVKICNEAGFLVNLDFIIAFPDETTEERQETLEFIRHIMKTCRVRIQFHHFFPISGCRFSKRLPSFLTKEEKDVLLKLHMDGVSTASWVIGEKVAQDYLLWLKKFFPTFYKAYK
jgi:B12-binding domain/radical SAM domain protein